MILICGNARVPAKKCEFHNTNTFIRLFTITNVMSKPIRSVVTTKKVALVTRPYSQAVKANGFLYVSGCIGVNKKGELVGDELQEQVKKAIDNMLVLVKAGNSQQENVVKVTMYLRSMKDYDIVDAIYQSYFNREEPARTTICVIDLPKGALFQIDCVALTDAFGY